MAAPVVLSVPKATNLSTPDRSKRRLSEVTKKLVYPSNIKSSGWSRVLDTCVNKLGIEFDEWQNGAGRLLLAKRPDGKLVHTIGGFGMSICRQTGKTYFISGATFGLSINHPGLLTLWSAHHTKTSGETFLAMQAFAQRPMITPYIRKVYTGAGTEEVRFTNGSRILFGARERGFGRGMPGVDILVNDEGQILSERSMQAMLATMNTSWLGLHIYAGTPPEMDKRAKAETWMRMHDEAWADDIETNDMVWIEMGADDDADLDDMNQWLKANPSFPHRTPIEGMQRLRRKLNDDGFRREALGLYDKDEGSIFDLTKWKTLADLDVAPPTHAALVLDTSPDRRWSSIGIAGEVEDGRVLVMVHSIRGTHRAIEKVCQLRDERDLIEIAITGGAARALETDLVDAGIDYEVLTSTQMSAAYANLQEKIKADPQVITHVDQPELNFALANSRSRYLQTGESEAFDRRDYSVDISSAVAAAGALYRYGLLQSPMPVLL